MNSARNLDKNMNRQNFSFMNPPSEQQLVNDLTEIRIRKAKMKKDPNPQHCLIHLLFR